MKISSPLLVLAFTLLTTLSCQTAGKWAKDMQKSMNASSDPTESETASGLKEALEKAVKISSGRLSATDGFFKDAAVKVLFPPEAAKVDSTLRKIGLGSVSDQAILSFNRAAESASKGASDIFISSIRQMTISDAMNILFGPKNAATEYLRKTTTDKLYQAFYPTVSQSLNKVGATRHWSTVMKNYNQVPFVSPVQTDLTQFVTNKAMDGIFLNMEKEELKIRENPIARTTTLLKKVFGFGEKKRS